jgi:hypothetical protein
LEKIVLIWGTCKFQEGLVKIPLAQVPLAGKLKSLLWRLLNTSRKHVNYEEDKIKYPWTSLTTSKIRIFAMVFSIFHFLKEGERETGRNNPGQTGIGAKRLTERTGFRAKRPGFIKTVSCGKININGYQLTSW